MMAGDATGDMTVGDVTLDTTIRDAPSDVTPEADMDVVSTLPCGTKLDGGFGIREAYGPCPGTEICCHGGVFGTYYCYSGTPPCPLVP
jgi:hypothetical protein